MYRLDEGLPLHICRQPSAFLGSPHPFGGSRSSSCSREAMKDTNLEQRGKINCYQCHRQRAYMSRYLSMTKNLHGEDDLRTQDLLRRHLYNRSIERSQKHLESASL